MTLDWDKLEKGLSGAAQIEPRKIFSTLAREQRFKRPTDEQGEVLDAWFERRMQHDVTVKMNTGSGKTLVGLLILQSCLNEDVAPVVYIAPDNYLVEQVVAEAKALGRVYASTESCTVTRDSVFRNNVQSPSYKAYRRNSVFKA